jgi:hypothetical protein
MTPFLDKLCEPTPAVRWLMRAGPIAERLNRDSKLDVFPRSGVPAQEAAPSDDE